MHKVTKEKDIDPRRKRVDNIKVGIVVVVLLGMIIPMVFCLILAKQVSNLNKQVEVLIELHKDNDEVSNITKDKNSYAYASEIIDETIYVQDEKADIKDEKVDVEDINIESQPSHDHINISEDSEEILIVDEPEKVKDGKYEGIKVYLTFDDGPSIYSNDILNILDEYDVKATFFVNGKTDWSSKEIYRRIVNEGHTLGMHSYSHDYGVIYNSLDEFENDFTKLWNLLYDVTGHKATIYRFPGGSLNYVNRNGMDEFIRFLNEKSIKYYDWNVVNGDASGIEYTKEQLEDNVLNGIESKKTAIVLMHDTSSKRATVESLPELIESLLSEGATILPLDETVTPIQQIKANSIE